MKVAKRPQMRGKKDDSAPKQLTCGWAEAARIVESGLCLGNSQQLYREWQMERTVHYKYDWSVTVPEPENWTGGNWTREAKRIKDALNREQDIGRWSGDVVEHVLEHVCKLERDGLLPDFAVRSPLKPIPKDLCEKALRLWQYHNGEVWLCITEHPDYPVNLADAEATMKALRGIRRDITRRARKTPAWAGIEATPQGEMDVVEIMNDEWEVVDTVLRGTGWHAGVAFGPAADRSGCTFQRKARSVFDLLFWMNYHNQNYDQRLKAKVVNTRNRKKGVKRTVHVGEERRTVYLTVSIPKGWAEGVAEAVADGLACRAELKAMGRKRMPVAQMTVQSRRLNTLCVSSVGQAA